MNEERITAICDNCDAECLAYQTHTCDICGATLCPDCICEDCENE